MRMCGYQYLGQDTRTNQASFIRRAGTSDYPRFHIHAKIDNASPETLVNLHLDQKKPSYQGSTAHSGEHDGEVVEREADRIKSIIENEK